MSRKRRRQVRAIEQALIESAMNLSDDYVDPRDDLYDPKTGETWLPMGTGSKDQQERGGVPQTEEELSRVRQECRLLAALNEFAINGHENRISYIVGSGHTYDVAWKKGRGPEKPKEGEPKKEDPKLEAIKAAIDKFVTANRWQQRQQEIVRRKDRDGECFLRIFQGSDGITKIRFVEPVQVAQPAGNLTDTFGIKTDPDDVETAVGYWIDGQLVPAEEIQHRKSNVDSNVKRGLPTFWPVRKNLRRAEQLLRNMSVVSGIQTAIAIIRKHQNGTKSGVEQFIANKADVTATSQRTGKTTYFTRYAPGSILDATAGTEYDFPAKGLDAGKYVQVLQAELRAIASRLVMPEFMLSSDASNANYSSTMVAEGPAVKMFQRLQFDMIEDDLALIRMALLNAGISEDLLDQVEITATPPNIQTRDRTADTQADKALVDAGAMSRQTMAERNDLDWDKEEERIKADDARTKANAPPQLQLSGQGGGGTFNGKKTVAGSEDDPSMNESERLRQARALLWEGYP